MKTIATWQICYNNHCVDIPVYMGEASCYSSRKIEVPVDKEGYLASIVTAQSGRGSTDCPWILTVERGQKLNITLLDFTKHPTPNGSVSTRGQTDSDTLCYKYATIREPQTSRETVVCGGEERERVVYISVTNKVQVEIAKYISPKKDSHFLLKYKGEQN